MASLTTSVSLQASGVVGQAGAVVVVPGVPASPKGSATPKVVGQQGTQAVPIVVRIAIKAAFQVLKKTNASWYWAVLRQVAKGKIAFVKWWKTTPGWVKAIFGTVSAEEIYETAVWLFGIG
ncbi:hypothetical protein [Kineococcus auxinigenes]|uniref:hypothetical protein n=1 Tax=unclassified Kineococcus TaxID=2621656 RepID=UPI003D7D24AB